MGDAFVSLNGITVITGRVVVPASGCWYADLLLDTQTDVHGPLTFKLGTLNGKCRRIRSLSEVGARGVRVVGGNGGWQQTIDARQYANVITMSVVLSDAAMSATIDDTRTADKTVGETVAITADRQLPAYVRTRGPAGLVLNDLASGAWWMGFDGVTNVGPRVVTPIISDFTVNSVKGAPGMYTISTEKVEDWTPGRTFASPTVSGTISIVEHRIEKGQLRTLVMSQ